MDPKWVSHQPRGWKQLGEPVLLETDGPEDSARRRGGQWAYVGQRVLAKADLSQASDEAEGGQRVYTLESKPLGERDQYTRVELTVRIWYEPHA
jgi:hypothetical protein